MKRPDISQEDKEQLIRLRDTKKWNPYNMRHSGVTRMARNPNIKESDLIKIGGWRDGKMLREVYKNITHDDALDDVMLAFGVDTRGADKKQLQQMADEQLRGIFCWHCGAENVREAQFCSECDWVLTDKEDARAKKEADKLSQQAEQTKREIAEVKSQLGSMGHAIRILQEMKKHLDEPSKKRVAKDINKRMKDLADRSMHLY